MSGYFALMVSVIGPLPFLLLFAVSSIRNSIESLTGRDFAMVGLYISDILLIIALVMAIRAIRARKAVAAAIAALVIAIPGTIGLGIFTALWFVEVVTKQRNPLGF